MPFYIKVDEDLPAAVAELLRVKGYDAANVIEQGMGGWSDINLWQRVQNEGRFLITADKGFGDIRAHPPGSHEGILLLRPDEQGIRPLVSLLEKVLSSTKLDDLKGTIAVANPKSLRVRRR